VIHLKTEGREGKETYRPAPAAVLIYGSDK